MQGFQNGDSTYRIHRYPSPIVWRLFQSIPGGRGAKNTLQPRPSDIVSGLTGRVTNNRMGPKTKAVSNKATAVAV